eukprot:GFYU01002936.1.p1 GENE.GFYU01002936.1~~GFYU01002936.1.p1  ORF type:complete len:422 (+),score=96.28 GFYU01002936.1:208-1473(+)
MCSCRRAKAAVSEHNTKSTATASSFNGVLMSRMVTSVGILCVVSMMACAVVPVHSVTVEPDGTIDFEALGLDMDQPPDFLSDIGSHLYQVYDEDMMPKTDPLLNKSNEKDPILDDLDSPVLNFNDLRDVISQANDYLSTHDIKSQDGDVLGDLPFLLEDPHAVYNTKTDLPWETLYKIFIPQFEMAVEFPHFKNSDRVLIQWLNRLPSVKDKQEFLLRAVTTYPHAFSAHSTEYIAYATGIEDASSAFESDHDFFSIPDDYLSENTRNFLRRFNGFFKASELDNRKVNYVDQFNSDPVGVVLQLVPMLEDPTERREFLEAILDRNRNKFPFWMRRYLRNHLGMTDKNWMPPGPTWQCSLCKGRNKVYEEQELIDRMASFGGILHEVVYKDGPNPNPNAKPKAQDNPNAASDAGADGGATVQ